MDTTLAKKGAKEPLVVFVIVDLGFTYFYLFYIVTRFPSVSL